MSAINPIQGPTPPIIPQRGAAAGAEGSGTPKSGFAQTLRNCIDSVDQDQRASASAIQDLLTGKNEDVLPVVAAVAKADMSFKLLIGVRNKVIEAYRQTMNMQV